MQNHIERQNLPQVVDCPDGGAYRVVEPIGATSGSLLYRARSVQHAGSAMVKWIDSDAISHEQSASFRSEYRMLQSLDVPGIIKPIALIDEPARLTMILENVEGELLDAVLNRQRLEWPLCLRLAWQLARMLAGLHASGIIHRDFRPANIMLTRECEVCLVDVHQASVVVIETGPDSNRTVGDWAYVSPELTGRMNRLVDSRTDLYSLGVMLYRMLTGQLPFHANDALEWTHCHIARLPRPPAELNDAIPPIVADMVMKLLAKMPEDRYQSAHGLLHDLQACLEQWEIQCIITPFKLAALDRSEHVRFSPELVGRAAEIKQLLGGFEAMASSGRPALLLVSGEAGVGKSALVYELRQPIAARRGYFISGKFDQYQRDIPYATITQAFRELVQQLIADSEAGIANWRRQIKGAVGTNGQLLVDIMPQLSLIIGLQGPVPELPAAEAQNRFLNVFKQFIGVFAQSAHPLTLFLDDLQWADMASLRLVSELLSTVDKRFLLVVGAYRDNEVGPRHPLTLTLDQIRSEGVPVAQLALAPLSEDALGMMLDDMLQSERGAASALAQLIYQKTAGNPFFVIQFVAALSDEGLINFDIQSGTRRWDMARINAKGYTDNVAELMIDTLRRQPSQTQATLQRLACLGSGAAEATLIMVCDQPETDTQAAVAQAVSAGLLVRADEAVRFSHDRVQEAAYLSMPDSSRAAMHVQIGRTLMLGMTSSDIEGAIFHIVSHFNRGVDSIAIEDDKSLLSKLNFLAGKKAKEAIAYSSARDFLDRAFGMMLPEEWRSNYDHAFSLTLALSECEYLIGNYQRADDLANLILANAQSNRDRAGVYRLRTQLYQMAGRYDDALTTMFEAARLFDVVFPTAGPEMEAAIDAEVEDITVFLRDRSVAEFAEAPLLDDTERETVIALLVEAIPAAYLTRPDCFALITAKATNLSINFGCTEDACFAYSTYGMALLARHSDIATAFEYSELALQLNERLDGRRLKGRVLVAHALAFSPWKNSFGDSTAVLDQSFAASIEVGDLLYANFSALFYCWPMLQQGIPLNTVLDTARKQAAFARDNHNDPVFQAIRFQQQLAANLMGTTRGPHSLDDDEFDEATSYAALEKSNMGFGLQMAHIVNQMSAFIYGDNTRAFAAAKQASLYSYEGNGMILVDSAHHFYFALTLTALYPDASDVEQRDFAELLAQELERHRVWADHNAQNFLHSYALVGAEIARIEGRESDAARLYEQAISASQESGFVQNEALAFEVASKFYRGQGFDLIAETYLHRARTAYLRWGAHGKVALLDATFPQLHTPPTSASRVTMGVTRTTMPLDVLSVIKASQAISGQIVLDELASTLLRIVVENAGAQTGSLVLCGSEGLELAAEVNIDGPAESHATIGDANLPSAILNYVQRSREQVLLSDVTQPHLFSADPSFSRRHSKSVLCLPILRQETLVGLLYLENNLVTHAFAPQRVAVLELLASQAAISLENARLYGNLMQENRERQRAEELLRDADRRKDEFLAMLAHELRNPLAPISAAAHLLTLVSHDVKRVQQAGEIITRQVDHMTGLISDLLDVSRVTSGLVELDKQPSDVKQIVMEAIEQVRPLMEARRQYFVMHTLNYTAIVMGDHIRLVQVMSNLLNNAAKFTPEGGKIVLRMEAVDERIELAVEDNGIGMTQELIPHAFELFTQGARTLDRTQGGLGIGLALVKSLVELHHGYVSANSAGVGLGSVFTVNLPLLKSPSAESPDLHADLPISRRRNLRLMVVDDNVDAADMLAMLLGAYGHEVFIEYSAKKALERARIEVPDICLLDIGLPDMDGHELARKLRSQPETAGSILIAISGYGQPHERKDSADAGFSHHFMKPVDVKELLALLATLSIPGRVVEQN